jgi:hypothetical protein
MHAQQKAVYRMLLHARLAKLTGMAFQQFFSEAMRYAFPTFAPVKPQGNQGDWKNDGYERAKGRYFQVWSPEQLVGEAAAVEKLVEDFSGLVEKWNDDQVFEGGVKQFYFVLNDGYRVMPGGYPTTIAKLESLRQDYDLEECRLFLAKDLEDVVLELPEDKLIQLVGYPPNPAEIKVLHLPVVNEVVTHIIENTQARSLQQFLISPDFDAKITFNGLNVTATWLRDASFRVGTLEDYFNANSNFTRQEVRDRLNFIYESEKNNPGATASSPDDLLWTVLDKLVPAATSARQKKELQDAALVLLAYFFESCDVFEEPPHASA